MIVSFDFDSTLSHTYVQEYAKKLIDYGLDVWVITIRYDDLHKHLFPHNPTNEDLYKVTDSLGIPKHKIRFCNMRSKSEYLVNTPVLWHLDDDDVELLAIKEETNVVPVDVKQIDWKFKCNDLCIHAEIEFKNIIDWKKSTPKSHEGSTAPSAYLLDEAGHFPSPYYKFWEQFKNKSDGY